MCDPADGTCPVWERVRRTARKSHVCEGCTETIDPGTVYFVTSALWEGEWSRWKHCIRCDAMFNAIINANAEFGYYVAVDPRLDCGESWDSVFGATPEHIQALAFWLPGDPVPQEAV